MNNTNHICQLYDELGIIFKTKEEAIKVAKKMIRTIKEEK